MKKVRVQITGATGAGKSSVAAIIAEALEAKGITIIRTKDTPLLKVKNLTLMEPMEVTLQEGLGGIPGRQVGSIGGLETPT